VTKFYPYLDFTVCLKLMMTQKNITEGLLIVIGEGTQRCALFG